MKRALPLAMILLAGACTDAPAPVENTAIAANDVAEADIPANVPDDAQANGAMPPSAEVSGAHPTAPEPAPIPARFRGTWAETKALCADLDHHSRLGISGRTVRYPDFVLFGDSFTFPAADQFAVKGKVEGTNRPAEAHYSINAAGDVLTDEAGGGAVRVRCG